MLQVNSDVLINQLPKYFYARHLTPFLHLKKNLRSPSENLLETSNHLQTSLTVKNVVKSGYFGKRLRWRAPSYFPNKGWI